MADPPADVRRDAIGRLDALGIPYYITGSEALARYGEPRQTADIDLVLGIRFPEWARIEREFEDAYAVAPPMDVGDRWMASAVAVSGLGKVDFVIRKPDAWGNDAFHRRERWRHPAYGDVWVSSLEDLILAKLEWSAGTSELQRRDAARLIRTNPDRLDWHYLRRHAEPLGVTQLLEEASDEPA